MSDSTSAAMPNSLSIASIAEYIGAVKFQFHATYFVYIEKPRNGRKERVKITRIF